MGGFNIEVGEPTPDQQFDFEVKITDFDGDMDTSNQFSVGVDGTGVNDDDAVAGVSAFSAVAVAESFSLVEEESLVDELDLFVTDGGDALG